MIIRKPCAYDYLNNPEVEPRHDATLTINGVPTKDCTSLETPLHLVHPLIVKRHPRRPGNYLTRLDTVPKIGSVHLFPREHGVPAPAAAGGVTKETEGRGENGTSGRRTGIAIAPSKEDEWAEEEDNRGEGIGKPKANVLF